MDFTQILKPLLKVILITFLLLSSALIFGQSTYPRARDTYVNDFARIMGAQDIVNIKKIFADLKLKHGIEAVVLTINSITDYSTGDKTIESFATHLFNDWGIGDKRKNDGVLILVAVKDRKMRIEVGSGYGDSQNTNMSVIIEEHMLYNFKKNQYSKGIYLGSRAVVHELTGEWPENNNKVETNYTTPSTPDSGKNDGKFIKNDLNGINLLTILGGFGAAAGVARFGRRKYLRHRNRNCPDCDTSMLRLDEISDDMYLTSGQKVEELLKTVDYDVWKCPSCNLHEIYQFKKMFSKHKECPNCFYKTLNVSHETINKPTTESTGKKIVTRTCNNCNYYNDETIILPKSSSGTHGSGSGSFGGGSSSGGGASGSW